MLVKILISKLILISTKCNPSCMSLPVCAGIERSDLLVTAVKFDFVKLV